MNNDSQKTDRISDCYIEEIEQSAVNSTPQNAEDVLALARANEDDHLQYQTSRQFALNANDNDTLLIIVDSHIKSSSSSVFNKIKTESEMILQKAVIKNGTLSNRENHIHSNFEEKESKKDIQTEEIYDNESAVISYVQNQNTSINLEHSEMYNTKKPSILEKVPKMETIFEEEQYVSFQISSKCEKELRMTKN